MNRTAGSGSGTGPQARSEAVQPSLWDRLVNDLPGLDAEIESLRRELTKRLGDKDRLTSLLDGGHRAVVADPEVDEDLGRRIFQLSRAIERRRALQSNGIVVDRDTLREAVRRDIETLFNNERMEARPLMTDVEAQLYQPAADLLADFPNVRTSVLNYGVPAFAGRTGTDFDKGVLARDLKQVLIDFEPRLKPSSIRVTVRHSEKKGMRIDLDAVLMLSPTPERLKLSTTIDLNSGAAATVLEDG